MERLAKRIARSGLCSRRDAEKLIFDSRVWVDDVLISTPAFTVGDKNLIKVDGKLLSEKSSPRLWGFYKPAGLITTHKDPQGRSTVFENLPKKIPRVVSIGRLDLGSEGLLLLTTDAQMARYAELPSTKWPRCYRVRVFGTIAPQRLADLEKGITIDDVHYSGLKVEIDRQSGYNTWLYMILYEGKNREIRKIITHLGGTVNRLIRVAYGSFDLQGKKQGDLWEIPYHEFAPHFPFLEKQTPSSKKLPPQIPPFSKGKKKTSFKK